MKLIFYCLAIIHCISFRLNAQEHNSRQSFLISTGIILEDGFVYKKSIPVLGLGYNYRLNKTFGIEVGLNSIFKTSRDVTNFGNESINIITRNSQNLFINQDDRDRITDKGIKDLSSDGTVKYLYLPLSLSLDIRPIKVKRSSLGFSFGLTAIYGSYKASRDEFTMNITLKDGTYYENVTLKQEIEFRNVIFGDSYSKLYYLFDFDNSALQLSLHSYNFFWSHDNTETNHLLTLAFISYL